jgi:hypothetical protein
MLRANVGLSRKISRDYNSTGYSVNLDGEIPFPVEDSKAVIEKVRELFSLAQEALNQEIDRDQGENAIGRRDEERPTPPPAYQNKGNASTPNPAPATQQPPPSNSGGRDGQGDAATNKQVQFLLTMGKRFKLSQPQLEARIAEIIGRRCGVYDLTKKEAGQVLDQFTKPADGNGNGNGNGR